MSVSLCILKIEIEEDQPEMSDSPESETTKEQKRKERGARESKTITVETYASVLNGPNTTGGILPTSSRRTPPEDASTDEENTIAFFYGNPLVEVTKGVLHLYKEDELQESPEARILCLLSVPAALGARDLLAFAAACQEDIAHVRVVRDGSPDHYMALLTFRTSAAAREFHAAFSGAAYTSLEPAALCHMAWVRRVDAGPGPAPNQHNGSLTELPVCAVCLERMDESVAGVLSVQCAHAFHAACLLRWSDATCPVCRAACTPELSDRARCQMCEMEEESADDTKENISGVAEGLLDEGEAGALWICLICGHVGCGRYEKGHAAKHFMQSNHTYAMQLGSNRVWDYAGDNFVHRLVQNKPDGKLVSAESSAESDKAEFSRTLAAQLDAQRHHYQQLIDKVTTEHANALDAERVRANKAERDVNELKSKVETLIKDNVALAKKLQNSNNKLVVLQTELSSERALASALSLSQAQWQRSATEKEDTFTREISELRDQLRDVMFFVEARDRLEKAEGVSQEEISAASVAVAPPAKPRRKKR